MIEVYRGWVIEPAYMGYHATHPDFECDYDDEGGIASNGLQVHAMTIEAVKREVDYYLEENEDD